MIRMTTFVAGMMLAANSFAQAPAGAPAGSTGVCKDGSYWSGATKKGACRGHKGVQTWYGASDASTTAAAGGAAAAAPAAAPAPATGAPAAAPTPAASAPAASTPKGSAFTPPATAAPGGGPGMVWINKSSKVYHCPSDKWYGKTKNGAYESEADAKSQGYHPDHGKACS
jgi:pyruvate/2-oxoglutarate dehydrogenase complex dihydrolipoamide acyltransferase (E2) component